jgi:tRNA (Thr-GGU) A37 N-methylase
MNISLSSSGINLAKIAQDRTATAANNIASLGIPANNTDSDFRPNEITKSVVELKQAEIETSMAAKIIETEKKTIGSILDIKA